MADRVMERAATQQVDRVRYLILEGGEARLLRTRSIASLAGVLPAAAMVTPEAMERSIAEGGSAG